MIERVVRHERPQPQALAHGLQHSIAERVPEDGPHPLVDAARRALAQGCAHAVVYTEEDFVARTLALTGGRGCDVVYDAIGRDSVSRSVGALAPRGHIVSYGQAAGPLEPLDVASLAERSGTVSRPNYSHFAGAPEAVRASSARLFAAYERGVLRV